MLKFIFTHARKIENKFLLLTSAVPFSQHYSTMFSYLLNRLEIFIRFLVVQLTNWLPVKVVRDADGEPFLYRYHLISLTDNGPGVCLHRFVKSDPDRGYHDHPWQRSFSFILCGSYLERLLCADRKNFTEKQRPRWTFNYLNGSETFHRVMVDEGKDVWTLFFFQKRSKTWGMVDLVGKYRAMSQAVSDLDGGWWKYAKTGFGLWNRMPLKGNMVASVDIVLFDREERRVLLIKRGKDPYQGDYAFPGGRIEATDADILAAAHRELKEETNLAGLELTCRRTVGNSTRDPRGFSLSVVFSANVDAKTIKPKAGDDAVAVRWFSLELLPKMAFDHRQIVTELANEEGLLQPICVTQD